MSVTDDEESEEIPGLRPNGTADPAYAAALGLKPAGALRRSLAFLVDAALIAIVGLPAIIGALLAMAALGAASDAQHTRAGVGGVFAAALVPLIVAGAGLFLVYIVEIVQLVLHGMRGVTLGKAICGIRSVRVTTFARPGFWRMVLRALVVSAAFVIVPVVGGLVFVLSPLWDDERRGRGWHDYIGGNWLVDVRHGLDPFDTKGMRHARKRLTAPERVAAAPLPSLATGATAAGFAPAGRLSFGVVGAPAHRDTVAGPEQPGWTPPAVSARPPAAASDETLIPEDVAAAKEQAAEAERAEAERAEAERAAAERAEAERAHPERSAASAGHRGVATFVFDDGTAMLIDGGGLMGRNPQAREGEDVHHLIPVEDPTMQLSKTHVEFGVEADGVWISDRGSVNGTVLVMPEGERIQTTAGDRYPVRWGSVVEIGGRAFRVVQGGSGTPGEASASGIRGGAE